jgi:hypothetical protein
MYFYTKHLKGEGTNLWFIILLRRHPKCLYQTKFIYGQCFKYLGYITLGPASSWSTPKPQISSIRLPNVQPALGKKIPLHYLLLPLTNISTSVYSCVISGFELERKSWSRYCKFTKSYKSKNCFQLQFRRKLLKKEMKEFFGHMPLIEKPMES